MILILSVGAAGIELAALVCSLVYAVFLPQVCELAFDHIVDDPYALIMMDEGRFHRVEGELLQIL